ncbi:MAG: prepilin-type N-terminal cleavage/methylation domain-containing protein [Verrucomicrobiota bacterium]
MRTRWAYKTGIGSRAGFTLLEVMVGVGVLGVLLLTMGNLVGTQLTALRLTRDSQLENAINEGLVTYIQGALAAVPAKQVDALKGIPHLVGMAPADELQWLARPGMSLLTSAAEEDDYALTLTLQPSTATSRRQDLGIRRRVVTEADNHYEWIPLMQDVAALEFRYFHPALAVWVDRWEDSNARPALVRMKIWHRPEDQPFEVVLSLPSSRIQ